MMRFPKNGAHEITHKFSEVLSLLGKLIKCNLSNPENAHAHDLERLLCIKW